MPLVANDQSWCVCMPKKTGSQSLAGMCEGIASVVGEWHGCDWSGTGRRYLVVREPRERLASMYWYSQANGGGAWGDRGVIGWCERFAQMVDARKLGDLEWWMDQGEYVERFQPNQVFRLEQGLQPLLDLLGVTTPMQYRNKTKGKRTDRRPFAETFQGVPAGLMEPIHTWLRRDAGEWYS